ncbi:MAG: cytochrome c4 [Caulobacteraceae bacterium]|nr:cytochrome c4 [Caulobacteraceae bacterium]
MSEDPRRATEDRRWTFVAAGTVAGALAFSALVGFVVLPLAQAPNANLTAWTAICRAIGLKPGTPAQPQPPVSATARPVSQVIWSPRTLAILASADPRPAAALVGGLCGSCHGEDGLSVSDEFPKLAGQSPAAIYKQLSDYRSGARSNDQMTPVAQSLTQDQMAQVAAYLGHLRAGSILGRAYFDPDSDAVTRLAGRGDPARRIPPCEACHARNAGGPVETPAISGQNSTYLERQLIAFRTDARRNDIYERMRDIARRLRPDEIHRLAIAYQGVF